MRAGKVRNEGQSETALSLLRLLEGRRRELGMSARAVAERAGLGLRTVQRVLAGKEPTAKLSTVLSIADAVRVELHPKVAGSAHGVIRRQAREKAGKLAALVQGNSALEAQAVSKNALREIREDMTDRLSAGPRRRLWA